LIKKHAQEISLFVQQCQEFPKDLERIILQHHGSKSGDELMESYSSSIAPISIVFIVIRKFICAYLQALTRKSKDTFWVTLEMEFSLPSYHKVFDVLKKSNTLFAV